MVSVPPSLRRPLLVPSATALHALPGLAYGWVVAQAEQPLLYRLAPHQRVKVLAALAVVVLLGLGLILFAWWAARAMRRYLDRSAAPVRSGVGRGPRDDDWATKPLCSDESGPRSGDDREDI